MEDKVNYDKVFLNLQNDLRKDKIKIRKGNDPDLALNRIPIDISDYDNILGGGYTRGGLHMLTGESKSGKTTIALKLIASAQKRGFLTAYYDIERRFDPEWFSRCGVDLEKLHVPDIRYGEEAVKAVLAMLDYGYDVIVVDSFASLTPLEEDEDGIDKPKVAIQARMLDKAIKLFIPRNRKTVLLGINQYRTNITMSKFRGLGDIMPGGRAQYYNAHSIMEIKLKTGAGFGYIKEGDQVIGHWIRCLLLQSLHSVPRKFCDIPLNYITGGTEVVALTIDMAVDLGIIGKKGAGYFNLSSVEPELKQIQGIAKVVEFFKTNGDKYTLLKQKIEEKSCESAAQQKQDEEEVEELT